LRGSCHAVGIVRACQQVLPDPAGTVGAQEGHPHARGLAQVEQLVAALSVGEQHAEIGLGPALIGVIQVADGQPGPGEADLAHLAAAGDRGPVEDVERVVRHGGAQRYAIRQRAVAPG
jgi:hypothetical protein